MLIVTYHTSHNNHYDLDVVRQLKKFGIQTDICHLMCCNHKPDKIDDSGYILLTPSFREESHQALADSLYRFVEFDDNLFLKYDTIIYFAAMSGGDALKVLSQPLTFVMRPRSSSLSQKSLGDNLMEYLKSGGGVIFCIYTHMKVGTLASYVSGAHLCFAARVINCWASGLNASTLSSHPSLRLWRSSKRLIGCPTTRSQAV